MQNVFSMPPSPPPPLKTAPASSSSFASSFDFSLPDPSPQHHHAHLHHPPDQYTMSTLDLAFPSSSSSSTSSSSAPPPIPQTKATSCSECSHLLKQLGESLDHLDKVQAENIILKENLNSLSNRTKMLFTAQDCDVYEEELLQCFQRVKERKVSYVVCVVVSSKITFLAVCSGLLSRITFFSQCIIYYKPVLMLK